VRLVYRKAAERSHASAAFLAVVEGARAGRKNVAPDVV